MKHWTIAGASTAILVALVSSDLPEGRCQEAKAQQYVHVPLVRADAVKAAKRLSLFLGKDTDAFGDKKSNTVFIRASADKIQRAKDFLQQLDEPSYFYIISLKNAEAVKTAERLSAIMTVLWLLGDDRYIRVTAVDMGIAISATEAKAAQARTILRVLDVKQK
jgi:type II secretory pathway component GspD/PulD (secretin)